MAEKKEKRYVSDNAQLMTEWDWEKNTVLGFDPQELTCGSGKIVWWKCSKGHNWEARIADRESGKGCPYCSGRYAVKGLNDLETASLLVDVIAPQIKRDSGYLRIEHAGYRRGDNAEMGTISFVDEISFDKKADEKAEAPKKATKPAKKEDK